MITAVGFETVHLCLALCVAPTVGRAQNIMLAPSPPPSMCHPLCPQTLADSYEIDNAARSVHNVMATVNYYQFICDATDSPIGTDDAPRWVHFYGDAGRRMPTAPVGAQACGSLNTGWLATPHPPVGGEPRNGTVCFQTAATDALICENTAVVEVCAQHSLMCLAHACPAPARRQLGAPLMISHVHGRRCVRAPMMASARHTCTSFQSPGRALLRIVRRTPASTA